MNIDAFYELDIVCGHISECSDFSQDIRALSEHALARSLLEKLGEVFKNNFLTAITLVNVYVDLVVFTRIAGTL